MIEYGRTPFETRKLSAPRRGLCLREVQAYFRFLSVLTAQWVCVGMPISSFIGYSFIGYYEVAQEIELKFVHQNSPTVQLNTSLTQSQARNLKMANCDCTTFLLCPPTTSSSFILISGSLYELFTSSRRIYLQFKQGHPTRM